MYKTLNPKQDLIAPLKQMSVQLSHLMIPKQFRLPNSPSKPTYLNVQACPPIPPVWLVKPARKQQGQCLFLSELVLFGMMSVLAINSSNFPFPLERAPCQVPCEEGAGVFGQNQHNPLEANSLLPKPIQHPHPTTSSTDLTVPNPKQRLPAQVTLDTDILKRASPHTTSSHMRASTLKPSEFSTTPASSLSQQTSPNLQAFPPYSSHAPRSTSDKPRLNFKVLGILHTLASSNPKKKLNFPTHPQQKVSRAAQCTIHNPDIPKP